MKKHYSKLEKQKAVEVQSKSGLSIKQWCVQNNIPVTTFYGWIPKKKKSQKDKNKFVEIKNKSQIDHKSNIIIEFNNIKISISQDVELLEKILKVL